MAKGPVGKYKCSKCDKEISLIAKTRHDRSCDGTYRIYKPVFTKTKECVFCGREFTTVSGCGSHAVQCEQNPERVIRKTGYSWNKGLTIETDERVAKSAALLRSNIKPNHGQCKDPNKEIERRKKISLSLKETGTAGGYRENAGRSKKFSVYDSFGNKTTLQSSYEYAVFEILCELGIRWMRPKALS